MNIREMGFIPWCLLPVFHSKSFQDKTGKRLLNVFVPTTPNPTSGFFLMVPEEDVTELDITPEEAFKLIISGGMASK